MALLCIHIYNIIYMCVLVWLLYQVVLSLDFWGKYNLYNVKDLFQILALATGIHIHVRPSHRELKFLPPFPVSL